MARSRPFGSIKDLPNHESVHQTPASLMIDCHYASLRLVERWSWVRYVRLCKFLNFTPWELASLVMLRHAVIAPYQRTGRLPAQNARAIAMMLTLIEAHVMAKWTDDTIPDPFPKLPVSSQPESPSEEPNGRPEDT